MPLIDHPVRAPAAPLSTRTPAILRVAAATLLLGGLVRPAAAGCPAPHDRVDCEVPLRGGGSATVCRAGRVQADELTCDARPWGDGAATMAVSVLVLPGGGPAAAWGEVDGEAFCCLVPGVVRITVRGVSIPVPPTLDDDLREAGPRAEPLQVDDGFDVILGDRNEDSINGQAPSSEAVLPAPTGLPG